MHPMINIATKAARKAGSIMLRHIDCLDTITVSKKGHNDFVSEIDRQCEQVIIDTIHAVYPQHGILGEESGRHSGDEVTWVIDPLDGTLNYLHGFPHFCVSIAVKRQDRLEHGLVYDPLREELFTATRGQGAQLNGKRLRVSKCSHLRDALLGTGFPGRDLAHLDTYIDTYRTLIPSVRGIRRAGSAALDLVYVAAGRLDGFWERGLQEWDVAAGILLVEEAGGLASDVLGDTDASRTGNVLAATPGVFNELLRVVRSISHAPSTSNGNDAPRSPSAR